MKKTLSHAIIKPSLPFALIAPLAFGQSADLGESVVVGDIRSNQVTSLKSGTPILDVPQSLSIFTAEQISEQGLISLGDLVEYTPGVNNTQGEGHRDAIVFRGVRSTADFFVDGVRDDVQYYRSLYNVEQVEILRGPSALFFGRGGTGGLINRVTKKAQFGQNFSAYQASIDSFGETLLQFDTNYALSDKAAFRLNIHQDNLNNHRDYYDGNRFGFNPTFAYKLGDQTTLNLSFEHINHQRFIDRGIPTGTNFEPVESLDDITFGDPELNTTETEGYVFRTNVEHSFSDSFRASFNAGYSKFDKLYQNLYASDYDQAVSPNLVELDGYRDLTLRDSINLSANFIKELETGSIGHKLTFGVDFITTSNENSRYDTDWDPDPTLDKDKEVFTLAGVQSLFNGVGTNSAGVQVANTFGTDLNRSTATDITAISVYLQDEIAITDQIDVILGARFDSIETDIDDVKAGTSQDQSDTQVSPRIGIVYKPVENASIYASYSESFLPSSGEQFKKFEDQLDPDTFSNLEFGVKYDFNEFLSATASVFEITKTDTEDDGTGLVVEIDSETTGWEAQLQGKITDRWYITAGYSYLDGEDESGNRLGELPENTFSVWNQFAINEKFGVGLGVVYQDESLISTGKEQFLPDYVRVDASAYYQVRDNLRLQLNIENLTDTTYFPYSHSTHQASVGAPIAARLSVTGTF